MATSLKSLLGGGAGVPLGGVVMLPNSNNPSASPVYESGGARYLRSGSFVVDDVEYGEANVAFAVDETEIVGSGIVGSVGGVAYVNGVWFVYGGSTISKSLDGRTWTVIPTVYSPSQVRGISYINGKFVAFGTNAVAMSLDGSGFAYGSVGFGLSEVRGVLFDGTTFAAFGLSGKLASSTDGATWTARTSGFGTSGIYSGVYAGGMFVVAGASGKISTSTDGVTWTSRTSGMTGNILYVVHNGTIFLACDGSDVSTSSDGITWTKYSTGLTIIKRVLFAAGIFLIADASGRVSTSTDGATWTARLGSVTTEIVNVFYGGSQFKYVNAFGAVGVSSDGVAWSESGALPVGTLVDYVGFDGSSVLIAQVHDSMPLLGKYLVRMSGLSTWESMDPGRGVDVGNTGYTGARAAGRFYKHRYGTGLLASADGIVWEKVATTGQDLSSSTYDLRTISQLNGLMVAPDASSGYVLTSEDGVAWLRYDGFHTAGYFAMRAAYGDGKWVVVGTSGDVSVSADGVTWVAHTVEINAYLCRVAYGNGVFVATTDGQECYTSADAVTWSKVIGTSDLGHYYDTLCFGGGKFVMYRGPTAKIATSADGVSWTDVAAPAEELLKISYNGKRWIAVGRAGLVMTSLDATTWETILPSAIGPGADISDAMPDDAGRWVLIAGNSQRVAFSPNTLGLPVETLQGSAVQYMRIK